MLLVDINRSMLVQCDADCLSRGVFRWVSSAWLKDWADRAEPSETVDNHSLLCVHGLFDPNKVSGIPQLLSAAANKSCIRPCFSLATCINEVDIWVSAL